jgi:hypothetical protein
MSDTLWNEQIKLFLQERGQATPGLMLYHMGGDRMKPTIERCILALVERGEIEQCGTEEQSPAYLGQPLYALKRPPYWQERAMIERSLEQANEELLGLHRYGLMTYPEYTDIADLLVEARERLKKHFWRGE